MWLCYDNTVITQLQLFQLQFGVLCLCPPWRTDFTCLFESLLNGLCIHGLVTSYSGCFSCCNVLSVCALLAQISSLSSLPPAERSQRETTLESKRATVEAWLTREASTLQKCRLVWRKDTVVCLPHTHTIALQLHRLTFVVYSQIQEWKGVYSQTYSKCMRV